MTALAHSAEERRPSDAEARSGELLRGSIWVILSVAVGACTSTAFWLVAARLFSSSDVGRASGLFTSLLFVCFASGLGLPVAVSRFVAQSSLRSSSLFSWALITSAAASVLGALVYLGLVTSPSAALLDQLGWLGPVIFAVTAVGGSLTLLFDVRLMAARRWGCTLARVGAVGICQLALLLTFEPIGPSDRWLFLAAAGPIAASGFAGIGLLPRLVGESYRLRPRPRDAATVVRFASINYLATLASDAPRFMLPVVVLVNVPPSTNANFYVAWAVAAVAMLVPTTLGQVLLVEGSRGSAPPFQHLAVVAAVGMGAMALGSLVALGFQRFLVLLYGPAYERAGSLLPVLLAAGVPWALTSVLLADARVRQDHFATLLTTSVLSASVLVPAAFLVPRFGLAGASWPWLLGNVAAAAVGVLLYCHRRAPSAPLGRRSSLLGRG